MIVPSAYKNKTVGVFGLGLSGAATVAALKDAGANVFALDDDALRVADFGADGADWRTLDLKTFDALVLAPGVPLYAPEPHPIVEAAKAAQCPLLSDFDLFESARAALPSHRLVAVTGTNGKSTTTALMTHVLRSAKRPAQMGGNIGVPILAMDPLDVGGVYVIEASSFQLDLTQSFKSDVAILLNMAPDHLDRHGDMGRYQAAKARLFDLQDEGAPGIVSLDDPWSRAIRSRREHLLTITGEFSDDATLCFADGLLRAGGLDLVSLNDFPRLRGAHNHQNIAAVYLACRSLGLSIDEILTGVETFPGLSHRQEWIADIDGVSFINDSKATNVDAAVRGLKAFRGVHWIAGGRGKGESYGPLADALGSVAQAYLIGEEAEAISKVLGTAVDHALYPDMQAAVQAASRAAQPGETVLLSPACAAFDQFKNFQDRGERFKDLVATLASPAVQEVLS